MLRFARRINVASLAFWATCSLVACAVAFPTVFVAVDHHGFERLAGHAHIGPLQELNQAHLHTFEVEHVHGTSAPVLLDGVNLVVRVAAEGAATALDTMLGLAAPVAPMAVVLMFIAAWPRPRRVIVPGAIVVSPPVRPPTDSPSV